MRKVKVGVWMYVTYAIMVSTSPIIMGELNLKICQNFVGAEIFLTFVGG